MIVAGSEVLVHFGQSMAKALGVSSAVIALSLVAIGTSLPELVTGVFAARKRVPDLALGNIVGANVLNLSLVVGVSGLVRPFTFEPFAQAFFFSWLAIFFTVVIALVAGSGRLHRGGGLVLLGLYVVYVILAFSTGQRP
jgi:cation:H+ antiporter